MLSICRPINNIIEYYDTYCDTYCISIYHTYITIVRILLFVTEKNLFRLLA